MKRPIKDILFVGIQAFLFVLYFFSPLGKVSLGVAIMYIGLVLSITGLCIIVLAILQLNKNLTPFPTPKEGGALIKSGLYKYVRHPIYSGIILLTIGFGIYSGSIWRLIIALALWILFYYKSMYEEGLLMKHFDEYDEYRKRTGRFFPKP